MRWKSKQIKNDELTKYNLVNLNNYKYLYFYKKIRVKRIIIHTHVLRSKSIKTNCNETIYYTLTVIILYILKNLFLKFDYLLDLKLLIFVCVWFDVIKVFKWLSIGFFLQEVQDWLLKLAYRKVSKVCYFAKAISRKLSSFMTAFFFNKLSED